MTSSAYILAVVQYKAPHASFLKTNTEQNVHHHNILRHLALAVNACLGFFSPSTFGAPEVLDLAPKY